MEPPDPYRLVVPQSVMEAFVAHARAELPNECCGFFAGRVADGVGRVMAYLPLVNERASPTAFATEARSLLAAFRTMRASGTEVLAVCHSHPTAPPVPSRTDVEQNTYGPTVVWVIVSLAAGTAAPRAWRLTDRGYTEAGYEIVTGER